MPLSASDILQFNSGGLTADGNATLGAGTTAGSTLLLILGIGPATLGTNPPTGFTPVNGDQPVFASQKIHIFHKSNVGAGETSWAIDLFAAAAIWWAVLEIQNIDVTVPVDVKVATSQTTASGTTQTTGTTPTSTSYDTIAIAVHSAYNSASSTVPTWSGQTGGFTELLDQGQASGATAIGGAVSVKLSQSLEAFSSTGTASATYGLGGTCVVYTATGAKKNADVAVCFGGEIGTAAGLNTGAANCAPVDAMTGSPAIVASTPRSGSYCLELSSSAAAENVQWTNGESIGLVPMTPAWPFTRIVARVSVRFPSSLPAGDVDLFAAGSGASAALSCAQVRFRVASSKLGLTVQGGAAGGTEQLSATTVAADTWYDLDVRFDQTATTWTADWRLDGVDQTQASKSGEAAAQAPAIVVAGWTTSATATVRYDDIIISKNAGHYPLGDFQVLPVTVDPAGTVTLGGGAISTDFETFTSNGTTAAWNATTARDAINEVPPTIGASADGLCQVTIGAAEYVEIPMTSVTGPPDAAIRAVRWYFCGWAATTTAATIGFRDFDGTTESILYATADPAFDADTANPAWVCRMARRAPVTGGPPAWTQAKLDALVARVGFSGDATPKIGVHAVIAEVAVQSSTTMGLFGDLAIQQLDPDSGGVLGVTVDTNVTGHGAELYYEESGSPTTTPVAADTSHVETIDAPDAPTVNYIALRPEPE